MSPRVVAVVGGGFSGVAVALHLLERLRQTDRVVLFEPGRAGRGVAFGTDAREHLLNVTADRMSLLPDDPRDFVRYLEDARIAVGSDGFAPRGVYGAYVAARLEHAISRAPAAFEHRRERAVDITRAGEAWTVHGEDTERTAHEVIVATGHGPPITPAPLRALPTERLVIDPYEQGALAAVGEEEEVLLVGTGLTAVDVWQTLRRRRRCAPVHALSPSGRWPKAHLSEVRWLGPQPELEEPPEWPSADDLARWLDAQIGRAAERGIPWQAVIDAIRPMTTRLWVSLADGERKRALDVHRGRWNRLRHRMPASQAEELRGSVADGSLVVRAGRLLTARVEDGRVRCVWQHAGETHTRAFDRVIACAGRASAVESMPEPWPSLLQRGLAIPAPTGLGVVTDQAGRVLDAGGAPSGLRVIGGLARPALFESTAVPELARQAADIAASIA
jgi:uncharacterized NAD(P)/FAD-binding protein YdhS